MLPPLFLAVFHSALGPSRRHSVPCVLSSHVSLLTEQRRSRNEPRVPTPYPRVRTGYTRGEVIAVTSEVWALAQDSNQPEAHKDQSTSERSRPGPQAKPVGKAYHTPRHLSGRSRLTQLRIWPGHPSTSGHAGCRQASASRPST